MDAAEVPESALGSTETRRRLEIGHGAETMWVSGEVDIATADEFHDALAARAESQPDRVLVDMSGVAFIDSTGLSTLMTTSRRVPIQIVHPSEFVTALLFVNGLEDVFGV